MSSGIFPSPSVRDTVRALQVDRLAVAVVGLLADAEVPCLLLKGAGTATLLYARGPGRNYADVDVLIPPDRLTAAGTALRGAGFSCVADDTAPDAAERLHPHSQVWRRGDADPIDVDVHFALPGLAVDRRAAWDVLWPARVALDLGDGPVDVPSPSARVLHVALHLWHHRGRHERARRDLERAVEVVTAAGWDQTADLAASLGATAPLAAALQAVPGGTEIAARHGLGAVQTPSTRLWMADPPKGTVMLARLRDAAGPRARLALLREVVAPPRVVLERDAGRVLASRRAYLTATLHRLLRAPAAAPRALRAYRAARAGGSR